jgi:hypothetical protein
MQASRFIPVRPTLCPEPLERRRLMSVVVENGVLLVTGTNGPDRIIVQHHAPGGPSYLVTVEALLAGVPPEVSVVPADDVRSILVRAYAGDDEVELSPSRPVPTVGPVSIPSRVEAGLGNDRVFGGTPASSASTVTR